MKRVLILAAATALALTACTPPPTVGRVVSKHYDPETRYSTCTLVGKVMVCTPQTDDADWWLTLTDGVDEWDVDVSQQRYERTSVGDTVKTEGES